MGTADALFGRCLQDASQVLWAADSSLPDPTGKGEPGCSEGSELLEEPQRIQVVLTSAFFLLINGPTNNLCTPPPPPPSPTCLDASQVLWAADSSLPDPTGKGEPGCRQDSELLEEPQRIQVVLTYAVPFCS